MKRYVGNNLKELEDAVHSFQKQLTQEYCSKYINKLKEVLLK